MFGIYEPNDDELIHAKNVFYDSLQAALDTVEDTREIILMGDLNGRTGSKTEDKIVGRYGEDHINDSD